MYYKTLPFWCLYLTSKNRWIGIKVSLVYQKVMTICKNCLRRFIHKCCEKKNSQKANKMSIEVAAYLAVIHESLRRCNLFFFLIIKNTPFGFFFNQAFRMIQTLIMSFVYTLVSKDMLFLILWTVEIWYLYLVLITPTLMHSVCKILVDK